MADLTAMTGVMALRGLQQTTGNGEATIRRKAITRPRRPLFLAGPSQARASHHILT